MVQFSIEGTSTRLKIREETATFLVCDPDASLCPN